MQPSGHQLPDQLQRPGSGMVSELWFSHTKDAISLKKPCMRTATEGLTAPRLRSIGEFFNTAQVDCGQAQQAVDLSKIQFADLHCVHQSHL